jgi:N-acetylglucosamine malate deacetylase 1
MFNPQKIVVIAPHPDDEVLGVGGTISKYAEAGVQVTVVTVAAHMPPLYSQEMHEQTVCEAKKAHAIMGVHESVFLDQPAVLLEAIPTPEFNGLIMSELKRIEPDVVLLPYPDRHVDHRRIFDAAMVATRPVGIGKNLRMVAAYETLSETHWNAPHIEPNFVPNWCVDITEYVDTKLEAMACYESQLHAFPEPRSLEAIKALALFRGSQAGMGYGEGLHIIRMTG